VASKGITIKIRAAHLPANIISYVDSNSDAICRIVSHATSLAHLAKTTTSEINNNNDEVISPEEKEKREETIKFVEGLKSEFVKAGERWNKEFHNLWCFGPRLVGPNILINHLSHMMDHQTSESSNHDGVHVPGVGNGNASNGDLK